jgi:heme-degrading monooxygenase HmoA
MDKYYTSGDWHVREGSEDEFIKRWEEFTGWARTNAHGHFSLIRENDEPRHFVSIGRFASPDDVKKWMSSPQFQDAYDAVGGLCDSFHGAAYSLVTSVD